MTVDDDFMTRMHAIQTARAEAIRPLAEIRAARKSLLDQLAATNEPYGAAYAAALAAGWREDELTELGAEAPTKRAKGRPRGQARKKAATIPAPNSGAESAAGAGAEAGHGG